VYGATPAELDEAITAAEAEYEQAVAGPARRCMAGEAGRGGRASG
jgi:hypothetical protein